MSTGEAMGIPRRAALGMAAAGGVAGIGMAASPVVVPGAGGAAQDGATFRQVGRGAMVRTIAAKLGETVSVRDFGATGDGTTDDTAAIQAAFDSGAHKVVFPAGRYVTGSLRLPDWLHIQGEAYQPGIGGDGRAAELRFAITSGAGLTCGLNPVIQNLFLQNTGGTYDEAARTLGRTTARAIDLRENALIEDCSFSLWHECIRTGRETFYLKTERLHFNRCVHGYRSVTSPPYNMHIDAPHSVLTSVFLSGQPGAAPRNVKVFGGSIEGYAAVARYVSELCFFGTYFESDAPHRDVVAIDPRTDEASVSLFGCLVFMNRTARFVGMAGLERAALTSVGNIFGGIGQDGGVCLSLPASGSVFAAGDRFDDAHPAACRYVDPIAAAGRYNIVMPILPPGNVLSAHSGIQFVGARGFAMTALAAEPTTKAQNMTVLADGRTWDPLGRGTGAAYWTMWLGSRWGTMDGTA